MKIIKFIAAAILLVAICTALNINEFYFPEERDYTNLTVMEPPTPEIAIDMKEEYNDDYMRLLWKISTGEHTKPEKNYER